jgi:type IV pilus assembly protein PilB
MVPADKVLLAMLSGLDLEDEGHILVVGSACGYVCSILFELGQTVSVLDPDQQLLGDTRRRLDDEGRQLAEYELGRASTGWPSDTRFDGIVVLTSQAETPSALLESLDDGSPLVYAEGRALGDHEVKVTYKQDGRELTETRATVRMVDRLGDLLVALDALRRDQVEQAAEHARDHAQRIGQSALQLFPVSDSEIYEALARQHGLRRSSVMDLVDGVDARLIDALEISDFDAEHVLPVRLDNDVLVLATDQPTGSYAALAETLGAHAVEAYLLSPTNLERLIRLMEVRDTAVKTGASGDESADVEVLSPEEQEAQAVKLLETLLLDAVGQRATDIHAERRPDGIRLRYRVDGELVPIDYLRLTPDQLDHVVNAIKVRADMDISEPRLPHDGRMRRDIGGRIYDLRIHTQPTFHGEALAIRLLPQEVQQLTVEELGFAPQVVDAYQRVLREPGGLVLVVGPTGSGKTTTLYAGLQELATDVRRKVVSVEDPVEYDMENIQQTQIREQAGLTFDGAVRSLVRHDPDVILLGEIRDSETAIEAVRASQTGHLVLSTVHANNTTDTIQRLFDLGVQANSVASELRAVFSQRLARRICDGCRAPYDPPDELLAEVFPDGVPDQMDFYHGEGCSHCNGRGTYGRIAVVEFLPSGPRIRKAIAENLQVDEFRDVALEEGLFTMRRSALRHVHNGLIALDELPKILMSTFRSHRAGESDDRESD